MIYGIDGWIPASTHPTILWSGGLRQRLRTLSTWLDLVLWWPCSLESGITQVQSGNTQFLSQIRAVSRNFRYQRAAEIIITATRINKWPTTLRIFPIRERVVLVVVARHRPYRPNRGGRNSTRG